MKDIHYTKKDFRIDWYSGSGAGGQHRNKHQNCCRIVHIKSGLCERGTENKSRIANQRIAFTKLAKRVILWQQIQDQEKKQINEEVIRNYNKSRNEVHDKASNLKMSYIKVVTNNNIAPMIEARRDKLKLI